MEGWREALNDIRIRLRLMFTRGRLTLVYPPEAGRMQTLQATGLSGETLDGMEHAEAYGLAASPLPGAEPFMGAVLGQRNQLVALVVSDPRTRPVALKEGEVVVWSAHGQTVWLREDGGISINVPGGDLNVVAPEANISVAGDATLTAGGRVDLTAPEVSVNGTLGVGTGDRQPVARIGDLVNVGSGSSAGLWPIVSGAQDMEAS